MTIQNSYAAAKITVEEGNSSCPPAGTALSGHPMYFGALIMMVGTPLALARTGDCSSSSAGVLVRRPRHRRREALREELAGYDEYIEKVQYRLVPGVW